MFINIANFHVAGIICKYIWMQLDAFYLLGLLLVSRQWVAAWHPNVVRFIILQHDHFLPDQMPGWKRYSFGVLVSSQTGKEQDFWLQTYILVGE